MATSPLPNKSLGGMLRALRVASRFWSKPAPEAAPAYDPWLARAFPNAPERQLMYATRQVTRVRLGPGERLPRSMHRLYIVTRGTGQVVREGPGGHEILLSVLAPGHVVRDGSMVLADTPLELLTLPASAL